MRVLRSVHAQASPRAHQPVLSASLLGVLAFCVASPVSAQVVFTVDSIALDQDANVGDGVCLTASGECTWKAARTEVTHNHLGGTGDYVIQFDPSITTIYRGLFSAFSSDTIKLKIKGPIEIDMSTDPEPFGIEAALYFTFIDEVTVEDVWMRGTGTADVLNPWSDNDESGVQINGSGVSCIINGNRITGVKYPMNLGTSTYASTCEFRNNSVGLAPDGMGGDLIASNGWSLTFESDGNYIDSNRIAGFPGAGLYLPGDDNLVVGNEIFSNGGVGLLISGDKNGFEGNTVHSNGSFGIRVSGDQNSLVASRVGTDPSGNVAQPNGSDGVVVTGDFNCIGTDFDDFDQICELTLANPVTQRTIISANAGNGLYVGGEGNIVSYAYVGLSALGDALGNGGDGIELPRVAGAVVGQAIQKSAIGSNAGYGIRMERTTGHLITGNLIGVGPLPFSTPKGNMLGGIFVDRSTWITIGGVTLYGDGSGNGNMIGDNGLGIHVGGTSQDILISSNTIGLGLPGGLGIQLPMPNGPLAGVLIGSGPSNVHLDNNTISSEAVGVYVEGSGVRLTSNRIGTDDTNWVVGAPLQIGNQIGVLLSPGSGAVVGAPGEGNTISNNQLFGIVAEGTAGADISSNEIGSVGALGLPRIGNGVHGVLLRLGASGLQLQGNEIAYNGGHGVRMEDFATASNQLTANSIHTNARKGIELTLGANRDIAAPTTTVNHTTLVEGSAPACPLCTVEIYSDDDTEGMTLEATVGTALDGSFSVAGAFAGPNMTCTVTSPLLDTSEFGCDLDDSVPEAPVFGATRFTKRDFPGPGGKFAGDTMRYEIKIENMSPPFADDPDFDEITDPLPADVAFVPDSLTVDGVPNDDDPNDGIGYDPGAHEVIWNGALIAGSGVTLAFEVELGAGLLVDDVLANQARLTVEVDAVNALAGSLLSDDPDTGASEDATLTIVPEPAAAAQALAVYVTLGAMARMRRSRATAA